MIISKSSLLSKKKKSLTFSFKMVYTLHGLSRNVLLYFMRFVINSIFLVSIYRRLYTIHYTGCRSWFTGSAPGWRRL